MIECRRILKWTYAYGYYAFADEEDSLMTQRRQFFEFLQGDAERILDQVRCTGAGQGGMGPLHESLGRQWCCADVSA